jgi:hypothetical protein
MKHLDEPRGVNQFSQQINGNKKELGTMQFNKD